MFLPLRLLAGLPADLIVAEDGPIDKKHWISETLQGKKMEKKTISVICCTLRAYLV